ncbi:MAG: asparagine synthase (glutamine-hydrolyzing) [Syntrophomonas sp.]
MCSISGLVNNNISLEMRISKINSMNEILNHRGPDDSDIWSNNLISIGHNRLAIIDLTDSGKQPMHRGDWVIVFNGEIYNYLEIRQELEKKFKQRFLTESDTEVILAAWEIWKEKSLDRFRGMWAFAIYNKTTHELYLCRDRFGIKPLYYYDKNYSFIFSSEIKAILQEEMIERRVYLPAVMDYLFGFHDHNEFTFFEDIFQIPPGHYLCFNLHNNNKKLIRYYDLAQATEGRISTVDEFTHVFRESVLLHLRSDVPVGTCLSGGLDSSSVASTAAYHVKNNYNTSFHAITAQSEDPLNDETIYAKQVVEHSELIWHLIKPRAEDFLHDWERCLWFQDEPTGGPSIFLQYFVMKTANEAGLKVMLDGQGGDEALFGYERYYPTLFLYLLKIGRINNFYKEFTNAIKNSKLNTRQMAMYVMYFLLPKVRVARNAMKYKQIPKIILEHGLNTLQESSKSYRDPRSLQIAEITKYQLPHLLRYEDRNSMAWSVEARVPFVDHEVIETAITLKLEDKIKNGYTKWALRKVMDGKMADSITWRKNKIGFEAPEKKWANALKSEMDNRINNSVIIKELNLHNKASNENKFLLYNLACWESLFNVNLS